LWKFALLLIHALIVCNSHEVNGFYYAYQTAIPFESMALNQGLTAANMTGNTVTIRDARRRSSSRYWQ
jgi:hypothetical protein